MSRHVWKVFLMLALAFVVLDSAARIRRVNTLTNTNAGENIAPNPLTASGYTGDQHNVALGIGGNDPYQWVKTTDQMVHSGKARIHHVDFDGPPGGRAAHWSQLLRWWTAACAWTYGHIYAISTERAVERVSPWANTALLVVILASIIPVIASRFGKHAAALFAIAAGAIPPFYATYAVGNFDHHGLAAACGLLTLLFLLAGGGGFVRRVVERSESDNDTDGWLQNHLIARRWFIASGIAGGFGLWVSAATEIPILISIGVAAIVSAWFALTRGRTSISIVPELWRAWGIAGCITSASFYVLEYFPSDFGLRLEVNHPLFSIAWFGAGDLICRLTRAIRDRSPGTGVQLRGANAAWLAADVLLLCAAPAIALLVPESFVTRPGSFLLEMHQLYTTELRSISGELFPWSWNKLDTTIGVLFVFLMMVLTTAIVSASRISRAGRTVALFGLIPGVLASALAFGQVRLLSVACACWIAVGVAVATIIAREQGDQWNSGMRRLLLLGALASVPLTVVPSILTTARNLATEDAAARSGVIVFVQNGGWVTAVGFLATFGLVVMAVVIVSGVRGHWSRFGASVAGVAIGMALTAAPIAAITRSTMTHWSYPIVPTDLAEVISRDVARKLRARLGDEQGTIAGEPTTTMQLIYFGGFRGIGTYMWENATGLMESTALFGARSQLSDGTGADEALIKVRQLGVTHIVVYSWQNFMSEYARLALGETRDHRVDTAVANRAFGPQLLRGVIPTWLRPLPYRVPGVRGLEDDWVWILEVSPTQTRAEAGTRLAQFADIMKDEAGAVAQVSEILKEFPDYVPALIARARVEYGHPERGDFAATLRQLRSRGNIDSLAVEDLIGLATVSILGGDTTTARASLTRALDRADERSIRRLPWGNTIPNFILMSRQLGLDKRRPELIQLALTLLEPSVRSQVEAVPVTPSR